MGLLPLFRSGSYEHGWLRTMLTDAATAYAAFALGALAVIGLVGVTLVALLSRWVLFSPEQLANDGFNATNQAFAWAVSGFTNATVWLIFGAFMFALGYEKTGLGRRVSLWVSTDPRDGHARGDRQSRRCITCIIARWAYTSFDACRDQVKAL